MREKKDPRRWMILLLLVLGMAIINFSNIILAVRAADIMDRYRCDATELAAVVSISGLPGALLSVAFGRLLDKRGCKGVMVLCLVLTTGAFLLRTTASSYWQLLLWTFLAGVFLVPAGVAPAKVLYAWFEEREMPLAMGLCTSSAGLGSAVGYATFGLLPGVESSLWMVTAVAGALALLWAVFGKNAPRGAEPPTAPAAEEGGAVRRLLRSRNLWRIMVCSFIASGVSLTLSTYLSRALAFMSGGQEGNAVAVIGSALNLCMILGGALAGVVVSRLQLFNLPFLALCGAGSVMLLLAWFLPFGPATYLCLPLAAMLLSGTVALNITRITLLPLAGDYTGADVATVSGLCNTALSLGSFALPVVISRMAGERYVVVFLAAAGLFLIAGVIGVGVPELGARGSLARAGQTQGSSDLH